MIDLSEPRRAQYLHKAWKRHQDAVFWVDINLALKKGLKNNQTRSNAIILQEILPAYCIPKVVRMETGEVIHGLDVIDLSEPRHAQYLYIAKKRHQDTVYWPTSILLWRKVEILSVTIGRYHSSLNTSCLLLYYESC